MIHGGKVFCRFILRKTSLNSHFGMRDVTLLPLPAQEPISLCLLATPHSPRSSHTWHIGIRISSAKESYIVLLFKKSIFSFFFFFESVKCHEGLYVIMLFMTSECFDINNFLAYACAFIWVFFHLYNSTYVDNLKTLIEHLNMQ